MSSSSPSPKTAPTPSANESRSADFVAQAEQALEVLTKIYEDRALLAQLDPELRQEILVRCGQVARPGPWAKRELARAVRRRRKAEIKARDAQALDATGIRVKRAEPVFATPALVGRPPVAPGQDIDDQLKVPTLPAPADSAEVAETIAADVPLTPGTGNGASSEPATQRVIEPRTCYVCKTRFHELHFFYDAMCGTCAELNYRKRQQTADLRGRVALVTGGRVKIGYQAAILLLRAGCHVIVTTRFPRDAAARFANEADFSTWGDRLDIYGLDLRHTPSVEFFTRYLNENKDRLDFIVNNACQTVRRPTAYYRHLMAAERDAFEALPAPAKRLLSDYEDLRGQRKADRQLVHADNPASERAVGVHDAAELSQLQLLVEEDSPDIFPSGQLDADLQQVDLRGVNSWRLPLSEVPTIELLEVHLVNAVAPFLLNARLKPLMTRHPSRDKHIVNVSAMEGQFYRSFKTDKHPHTNMAKASLNMMTRTSAADYIQDGIHMNSVDTGWITDEDPKHIADRKTAEHGFHPPLDIVDGAARIIDPIFDGVNTGKHLWGQFLKDYKPTPW